MSEPIPEKTQVHVDRLVGAKLGDLEVGSRLAEGRFGTLYRGRRSGTDVTVQVLRAELRGDDAEVRAVNAIKCAGIAEVLDFGEVPDGRRYRVLERLEGELLAQVLQRRGPLPVPQVVGLLGRLADVLVEAHAWALAHGGLGPSSVFVKAGAVKLIDFGLAKDASVEGDLRQLGALGFALLTGRELDERGPPPKGAIPPELDVYLRDLLDDRIPDAGAARREFSRLEPLLAGPGAPAASPAAPPRRGRTLLVAGVAALLAAGGATAAFLWSRASGRAAPASAVRPQGVAPVRHKPVKPPPDRAKRPPQRPVASGPRRPAVVPTVSALREEIAELKDRFQKVGSPADRDQAMNVLHSQELRLTGPVTEQDRKDVAQQLDGWRRSYLRRR